MRNLIVNERYRYLTIPFEALIMKNEFLYTILFGCIASILAVAAMIQNFIHRQHKGEAIEYTTMAALLADLDVCTLLIDISRGY